MRACYLAALLSLPLAAAAAGGPAPGQQADLALFGRIKGWPGGDAEQVFSRKAARSWTAVSEQQGGKSNLGIEWDEPREFAEIRAAFQEALPAEQVQAEYWVSSWPPVEGRGGWTLTDSPWIGEWLPIRATRSAEGGRIVFRFEPLSEQENENAKRKPGWAPKFRRALKVRLRFSTARPPVVTALEVYGYSRWNVRDIVVESGCEGRPAYDVAASAYNGHILSTAGGGRRNVLRVLYTEHEPDSNDRTIISLRAGEHRFGVAIDDVIQQKTVYVRDAGIFVGDGASGQSFETFLASGRMRLGRDIHSLTARQEEQSLERAMAEVPAMGMTNRRPFRHIPLGFFGNREKYALAFNGNVFIGKRETKLFADELVHLRWAGNYIWFKLGAGEIPDFRERERSATQRVLEDYLPIAVTEWSAEGIDYTQEAFATLIDAPLDPMKNRGDEPSILLTKVLARNRNARPARAVLWLYVDPAEKLRLRGEVVESIAGETGAYDSSRFRAIVKPGLGVTKVAPLPPESAYRGDAARWEAELAPGATAEVHIRLTLKTHSDAALIARAAALDYSAARAGIVDYWTRTLNAGMRLHVPDEAFNRFHRSALQHILLSVQRDVSTGLFMAPCGTFIYNMFANETNMLVRLLDMRGLHDLAAKFLEPVVALQGSNPFPGRFLQKDAIFHGFRVKPGHDYTHSGYNLNHGWTLWTLAEHYLFTRDKEWLRAKLPNILKGARWVVSERKATMRTDEDGDRVWEYGLLPAGQLEDNEEWLHWYAVNAYAYKGLNAAAQVVADLDPKEGAALAAEARQYRADIRAAIMRSMASAPVAPLKDGTWAPVIPPRTSLHGRDLGWIRNILYGALALIDCGVIDPGEKLAEWILKDHEDNLFMAPWSFSVPEPVWFSRGGITLQPNLVNTPIIYLHRDEIRHALRGFYNTFAVSYYPDVNAFTEWAPHFGASGGPFYKTSDEAGFLAWLRLFLLREEGDTLLIARGAPRRWFRTGQRIALEDAATFHGKVSFEIHSRADEGHIDARIELPVGFRGKSVILRVRHPDGKAISRVEVNGAGWKRFAGDDVEVPAATGLCRIRVFYNNAAGAYSPSLPPAQSTALRTSAR